MALSELKRYVQTRAEAIGRLQIAVRSVTLLVNSDLTRITRQADWIACASMIKSLTPLNLDVTRISAGRTWRHLSLQSCSEAQHREFVFGQGLCDEYQNTCDLLMAGDVFEHRLSSGHGARRVLANQDLGCRLLSMAPSVIRLHDVSDGRTRSTVTSFRYFRTEHTAALEKTQTWSWRTAAAVKFCLVTLGRVGRRRFLNDPYYAVTAWALTRKARPI